MQVVLNFCHHDRDRALALLQWMGELGGCRGHDLLLSFNQHSARMGLHDALVLEAQKHFDKVDVFTPYDEDERGWPMSPNHAWRHVVFWVREKIQKPWLWLEGDVVPIPLPDGRIWINEIAAEYDLATKAGKYFLGDDVNVPGSRRHCSGIAVYPAKVAAFTRRLAHVDREAFDMFFANEFLPHVQFTRLIQHLHHDPAHPETHAEGPTFPDAASLAMIRPEAVLWHRCKDGSLIDRLREKKNGVCVSGLNVTPVGTGEKSGAPQATPTAVRDGPGGSTPPTPASESREEKMQDALKVQWDNDRNRLEEHIRDLEAMIEVSTETQAINKLVLISKEPFGKARICWRLAAAGFLPVVKAKKKPKAKKLQPA